MKKWTEEEIRYLKKNIREKTYEEIAKDLGRTWHSVAGAIKRLKRKNPYPQKIKRLKRKNEFSVTSSSESSVTSSVADQSLCWSCARAGSVPPAKGCAWIEKFEPVKGWTAEKTKLGWRVIACPKLKRGKWRDGA
jgi:hypothetical protein